MSRKFREGQLGLFAPESDWTPPVTLPDLRGRKRVVLDVEGLDRGLEMGLGPGWVRGVAGGYLCGIAWAAEDSSGYAPIAHPETENLDTVAVTDWLRDLMASDARITFHNSPFDVGWLSTLGLPPPRRMDDTLAASVMVDENERSYSLDSCCERAGVPGKDTRLLREAVEAYGGNPAYPQRSIWRLPARYAGPYATQDAVATLALWNQTEPALRAQDQWEAYETEMRLVPMVTEMRRRGIRVDLDVADRTRRHFRSVAARYLKEIGDLLDLRRPSAMDEIMSPTWLAQRFEEQHISFPMTSGGSRGRPQGSFSKDWMEKHPHPLPRAITQARKFEEAASKFVDNFIFKFAVHRGGETRIHSEIHQFLSEEGGTRSHRFSYSDPPLQQMTSPDKDPRDADKKLIMDLAVGTMLRNIFLPEPGEAWLAADYSQQEPRMTVHFAAACGVVGYELALERYRNDPRTDYHTMVAEMTGLPRPRAKILNLAMTYGKGLASTAEELGVDPEEAKKIMDEYHRRLPFIRPLENFAKNRAAARGYIRLIDGARMHYNLWEGPYMTSEEHLEARRRFKRMDPCSLAEARERQADPEHPWHGRRLRRADTRKALNNLVQGSAARQTKRSMLAMWDQGIVPLLQMHDELDVSVSSRRQAEMVREAMVETTPLLVPVVVDMEFGRTWGTAKKSLAEYEAAYGALAA